MHTRPATFYRGVMLGFSLPLVFLGVLCAFARGSSSGTPRLARERIVLRTVAGDVVMALYPDVAPQHVQQLLKLVQLGCYDGTHFFRVEPGFVIQLADVQQRRHYLTRQQGAAIQRLPAEFSQTLKHRRGTLSMAHQDDKPDSAETSFSIVLDEKPHLDGKYTIFGHVEAGMDVVDELVKVPRFLVPGSDSVRLPVVPLEVQKALVVPEEELGKVALEPAHPVSIPPGSIAEKYLEQVDVKKVRQELETKLARQDEVPVSTMGLVIAGVGLMLVLALGSFFFSGQIPANWQQSIALLIVLVAGFMLLVLLTPYGQRQQILAAGLFLGVVGMFKLMGRFESAS